MESGENLKNKSYPYNKISNQEQIIKKLKSELNEKNIILSRTKSYLFELEYNLEKANQKIDLLQEEIPYEKKIEKEKINPQFSKLESKEYCISCLKEELKNKNNEIKYLNENALIKKIISPLSYIYLLFKSKPNEIKINLKLYKALKNSQCFDIGYYLNNNSIKNKFPYTYFSPEIHYIIKGFDKEYKFSKKYFNMKTKEELLNYIILTKEQHEK